jgi:hypothetical protein
MLVDANCWMICYPLWHPYQPWKSSEISRSKLCFSFSSPDGTMRPKKSWLTFLALEKIFKTVNILNIKKGTIITFWASGHVRTSETHFIRELNALFEGLVILEPLLIFCRNLFKMKDFWRSLWRKWNCHIVEERMLISRIPYLRICSNSRHRNVMIR